MLAILVLVLGLACGAWADLVAHYEFEGNAHDSSGNGLHGILESTATIILDDEKGMVLSLDGVGDYVGCGNDPRFNITGSITVASWIKVDVFDKEWQAVVTKGDKAWRLHRYSTTRKMAFFCTAPGGGNFRAIGTVNVDDDKWHHVAGVSDGNKIKLYVDGAMDSSDDAVETIKTNSYPVLIGENAERANRFWSGMIDDVRIYDNALSASEIAELAGTAGGGGDSGWVISGNNMYSDVSGNVGIGTDDPEYKLHVEGESDEEIVSVRNSGSGVGIYGDSFGGSGVTGGSIEEAGVSGVSVGGPGVFGMGSFAPGVAGTNIFTDAYGDLGDVDGVYGECPGGFAAHFEGKVKVTGRLTKGSGSFLIDHPLDPENKYLQHSFVESPDMMNIYNGNVGLDKDGRATVKLPDWFEALNKDFRYQLTCIGGFAPVYIAEKISDKCFKIAGGKPGMEISWQVTGIRNDPYARKNRIAVEEDKSLQDKGYYLHAEAYGMPEEKSIKSVHNSRRSKVRELAKKKQMSYKYN